MAALHRLWLLARPRGLALVGAVPLAGFGYGLWEQGSTVAPWTVAPSLLALFVAFGLGHAAALWVNASFDRDEGEVLLGAPVAPPAIARPAAVVVGAGAMAMAAWVHPGAGVAALGCGVLSVAYSHPWTAWKGHPLGGPAVNVLGYGTLAPGAGWLASGADGDWRTGLTVAIALGLIGAVYLAAQAFQREEDAARGYRTFVVRHGPAATLRGARAALLGALTLFAGATLAGAYPRALLVAVPAFVAADRGLVAWQRRPEGGTAEDAAQLLGRLAWAVGLVVLGAYAHQGWQLVTGGLPGGLGTALVP
jgi:4-hydroxybenzoate polyprenyltransferase